jgi:hypothetical protein
MKFMLLIYNNPDALRSMPEGDLKAIMDDVGSIMAELGETGELIGGEALAHPSQTKTVRVRDGAVATTDGPFVEAKEQFAGTLMVDVESEDRAVEIAARWPDARYCAMEVRAIMQTSGGEV